MKAESGETDAALRKYLWEIRKYTPEIAEMLNVDNVDNGEQNFFRFIIINLFLGKMVKSAVFYRIFTKDVV